MIERRTLSVSLTPELHAFIGELVKGGAYSNASEVVRAGLRLLREDEARRQAAPLTSLAAAASGGQEAKA